MVKRETRLLIMAVATLFCPLLALPAPPGASVPIPTFTIHNFLPEFWQFWEAAHDQPLDKQVQLWRDLYVKPHQAVFDDLAVPCKPEFDTSWATSNYFPNLPKIVPAMRPASEHLQHQLGPATERFLKMFPDMRWAGDIYIMASGYCFNGRAQTIGGRSAMLFGIDTIVALHQLEQVPHLHHELFHRYHHQFFDYEPSSGYPLWTTLWVEGMAVYVAEELNPAASDTDLSMVPLGMVKQVDTKQSELAADFLNRFDSTAEKDATVYFNDVNSKDPFVPPRAGYELGALVARRLAQHYTLQTMAHWSQQDAKPKIRETLAAIANSVHE